MRGKSKINFKFGAGYGIRTRDNLLGNYRLYPAIVSNKGILVPNKQTVLKLKKLLP